MIKRIGFACKWLDNIQQVNGFKPKDQARQYNTKGTTVTWLNRQNVNDAENKLGEIMKHNLQATKLVLAKVAQLPPELRMMRLSSDILPVYTESTWSYFWKQFHIIDYLETEFANIGKFARANDIRLSFHPGQFCVLASDNPDIVERSLAEFEYHVDMARWMGYGESFQDFKINVHISGRQGPEGIRKIYNRLTPEARNCITIENEENSYGLDDCLQIADIVPIVFDSHHHWVRTGEYINVNDDKIKQVIASWRGVRPTMHYSQSREDILIDHCTSTKPNYKLLLESGIKKQKLRAHSDMYWNTALNEWIYTFGEYFDIMCESKAKNLASFELYRLLRNTKAVELCSAV